MKKREIKKYSVDTVLKYAETVLKEHYSCEIKSIKYVGGGYFGYVYYAKIDKSPNDLIIKACLSSGMYENEARDLSLIREDCPIPVPEVYFTYVQTDDIPIDFICMEYMQGKDVLSSFPALNIAFVSRGKKKEFADKIVDAMGVWHSKTNDKFGLTGNAVYDNWFDYYKPYAKDILDTAKEMSNLFPSDIINVMEDAWDKFDVIFSEPVSMPALVHGDLNVVNIMCDNKLNPTAIIDPLESKWADKEYDLFQLKNFTGRQLKLYETYKSKYSVSKMVDAKSAFYGLFNEVYCSILADVKMNNMNIYVKWMKKELKKLAV